MLEDGVFDRVMLGHLEELLEADEAPEMDPETYRRTLLQFINRLVML